MDQFPIRRGSSQNPYQEHTFTLAGNGKRIIYDPYSFFVLLSLSVENSISVRFGQNGRITPITRPALNLNFTEVFDQVEIINRTAGSVTVSLALGIGTIIDTRLFGATAAGTVNVGTVAGTVNVSGSVAVSSLPVVTAVMSGGYLDFISSIGSIGGTVQTKIRHQGILGEQFTIDEFSPWLITISDDKTGRVIIKCSDQIYVGGESEVSAETAYLYDPTDPPLELWNMGRIYAKTKSGSGLTPVVYVIEERS